MSDLVAPCTLCGLQHPGSTVCPIAQTLASTIPPPVLAGTLIGGRYRIGKLLHQGPMSTVYRVADAARGKHHVVLKELNLSALPPSERAEALDWFLREAHLLSTIRHRALPRLHASFSEGDRHYLVMEEIPGQSIELHVRQAPLPEDQVLRWGIKLATVLHFLHGQPEPIVYRDLKPGNILEYAQTGSLVLVDFGVARRATPGHIGTAVGTPGYAAPEQYQGLADSRSDIYALGATLHQLLTGYDAEREQPFRHPPVRALRPSVGSATAAIVDRALSLEPDRRYGSARLMRAALRKALKRTPDRRYAMTATLYLWISLQPLIVVPSALLFLYCVALPLHVGLWTWPAFLVCLCAPTFLYRFPLRTLERRSRHSTDRAIISAVQGARRHLQIRTIVGMGFWLMVSLAAVGAFAPALAFLVLAILAALMWRVGVGRAGVGLLSRRRLRLQHHAELGSEDQQAAYDRGP